MGRHQPRHEDVVQRAAPGVDGTTSILTSKSVPSDVLQELKPIRFGAGAMSPRSG